MGEAMKRGVRDSHLVCRGRERRERNRDNTRLVKSSALPLTGQSSVRAEGMIGSGRGIVGDDGRLRVDW